MKRHRTRNRGAKRGRQRGAKIRYNAYQKRRYQSIWLRTERARRLQPPTQLDVGVWQFRSKRRRVKPYRTTTREGSLTPITGFTGTVTRSGKPPACPLPATFYDYLNPIFRWAASGIHDCSKDSPGDGFGSGTTTDPVLPPDDWLPVPPGGLMFLGVTVTTTATITSFSPVCGSSSDTTSGMNSYGVLLHEGDTIRVFTSTSTSDSYEADCNGSQSLGTSVDTSTILIVTGLPVIVLAQSHTFDALNLSGIHNTQTTSAVVTFDFDGVPNLPPPPYTSLPDGTFQLVPDGYTPPSMLSDLATAGIAAASNSFRVLERLDILTTIAYSIAAGMPDSSGSISLKLFADGVEMAALAEAPTQLIGSLNRPMTLLPDVAYQFKISIPESIYCDAAIVRLGGKFVCNCPDWNRRSPAFPSRYPSELGDRDWSTSGAGTRSDCKHIIYLKLMTGEDIDAEPDDLKAIRQWKKDHQVRQKALRRRERKAETQSRRDALKRVKQDVRGIRQREKAIINAARSEVKAARTAANRKSRKQSTKPRKYRGDVYTGGG